MFVAGCFTLLALILAGLRYSMLPVPPPPLASGTFSRAVPCASSYITTTTTTTATTTTATTTTTTTAHTLLAHTPPRRKLSW